MPELTREAVDAMSGVVLLEFGASSCGHCLAIQAALERLLAEHPEVNPIRIEDGPGLPLGRSFQVKLWPTFVFLRDGRVVERIVRPSEAILAEAFAKHAR